MMHIYISIGAQCTTPILFNKLHVKKESLPFDWMFSTPQFVYTILKLLIIDQREIDDIVDNHFFACDQRAVLRGVEHHILNKNGPVLVNTKYNVSFPHNKLSDRDTYVRRMERFKQILLCNENFLHFVYVSVSSKNSGNYTINGVEPIQQLYEYVEKINNIINSIRTNYNISIFDTNKPYGMIPSDIVHISYYDIQQKKTWVDLLPELVDTCNNLNNLQKN